MVFDVTNISNIPVPIINDLAQKINFLINIFTAFGGVVLIFIIFTIYKFFSMKKERRLLEEIRADIKKLNRKIKSK